MLEVTYKGKKVKVLEWELDDKMVLTYEAKWADTGKPLTEEELEDLSDVCAGELYDEASIDQASNAYDRAKDIRKYGAALAAKDPEILKMFMKHNEFGKALMQAQKYLNEAKDWCHEAGKKLEENEIVGCLEVVKKLLAGHPPL